MNNAILLKVEVSDRDSGDVVSAAEYKAAAISLLDSITDDMLLSDEPFIVFTTPNKKVIGFVESLP